MKMLKDFAMISSLELFWISKKNLMYAGYKKKQKYENM